MFNVRPRHINVQKVVMRYMLENLNHGIPAVIDVDNFAQIA
jgi:hypothetical protein